MNVLTARQAEIHGFMLDHQGAHHGIPPTFRELCKRAGIASTNGIHDHLEALVRKGAVVIERSGANSLYVALRSGASATVPSKPPDPDVPVPYVPTAIQERYVRPPFRPVPKGQLPPEKPVVHRRPAWGKGTVSEPETKPRGAK